MLVRAGSLGHNGPRRSAFYKTTRPPFTREIPPIPPRCSMTRVGFSLALTLALALSARSAEPKVVKLWPGKAPGETKDIGPERYVEAKKGQLEVKRLTDVSDPTIAVYSPPKDKNTGVAVVVAPGGAYSILAVEHEGTDVCEWLNSLGVTAVLLKYRVPKREMQSP